MLEKAPRGTKLDAFRVATRDYRLVVAVAALAKSSPTVNSLWYSLSWMAS